MKMNKLLFVDDEVHVLEAMKRFLHKKIDIYTAENGKEALKVLAEKGPFSVIISDMHMPEMNGIALLEKAKENYPDMIRIMLTGNRDRDLAIEAVNNGQIFKFHSKPISEAKLLVSIRSAIEQYRLVTAEKELLNSTLKGTIKVLCELLSFADATAFRSGHRIRNIVNELATTIYDKKMWQLDIAALMSQLGCITLPGDILKKIHGGYELEEKEQKMFGRHPLIGAKMLSQIPRLEGVAEIIRLQMKRWNWYSDNEQLDQDVVMGAQILKIAIDYDMLLQRGMDHETALINLTRRKGVYNPDVLEKMAELSLDGSRDETRILAFQDIVPGMIADEDVVAKNGALIIAKGQEITWPAIQGLNNFIDHIGIKEPIRVKVPAQ